MNFSALFARVVAWIGAGMILLRRWDGPQQQPVFGQSPTIAKAVPQSIPTLKMPTARGWQGDEKPLAAPGLKVNAFARNLKHPRQVYVLPNGDVLAAESMTQAGKPKSAFDYAISVTMRRAAASGASPNRLKLLRDADGDGTAEIVETFLEGLNQPYGMALKGDTLYVGNTDAVVSFPYKTGDTRITAKPTHHMSTKSNGHWTRNLLLSPDGSKLFVAVGSQGNIDENGDEAEKGRACIYELDLATGQNRIYGAGLRNPVGMAWEPTTGTLYTVVNERDGLGDEVPPDYLTSVKDGGFYGWPWVYWGIVDDRTKVNAEMAAKSIVPDYALGGHTASLGLCWVPAGTLPGFGEGMAIGQHGSWNRSKLSGYKMVFVEFQNGKPTGAPPRDILTGFLAPDEKFSYGRPVGVCIGPDGKSLLMADDVGDVIWRVTGA
jgi:glucose/arabinose dehydrogenase